MSEEFPPNADRRRGLFCLYFRANGVGQSLNGDAASVLMARNVMHAVLLNLVVDEDKPGCIRDSTDAKKIIYRGEYGDVPVVCCTYPGRGSVPRPSTWLLGPYAAPYGEFEIGNPSRTSVSCVKAIGDALERGDKRDGSSAPLLPSNLPKLLYAIDDRLREMPISRPGARPLMTPQEFVPGMIAVARTVFECTHDYIPALPPISVAALNRNPQ